jgi:hypothetical protein
LKQLQKGAEHLIIIKTTKTIKASANLGSTYYIVLWNELKEIHDIGIFFGALDESFGSTFGPRNTIWETLIKSLIKLQTSCMV